jgi:predicted PurR-regulated permease PerM
MAVFALIPAVGPAIVWLPAAIILLASGEVAKGLILIVIGAVVIGLVDNLLRPVLVGRDARLPDYIILLTTLGGITVFGLSGVLIGPIIAALFFTVWTSLGDRQQLEGEAPAGSSNRP